MNVRRHSGARSVRLRLRLVPGGGGGTPHRGRRPGFPRPLRRSPRRRRGGRAALLVSVLRACAPAYANSAARCASRPGEPEPGSSRPCRCPPPPRLKARQRTPAANRRCRCRHSPSGDDGLLKDATMRPRAVRRRSASIRSRGRRSGISWVKAGADDAALRRDRDLPARRARGRRGTSPGSRREAGSAVPEAKARRRRRHLAAG
jgi:hypothetical protein